MALALENGIEPEAAHKIIRERKLAPPRPLRPLDPWPRRYRVRMFGPFSLTRDGVCIAKAQSAKLALLQSLIWHGGRNVSIGKIVDDVWPEKDGDRAENTLQVTLLRLRELLGEKNAISVVNRTISLDPSLWGPDLEEFRSLIALLQEELAQARSCDKKSRITFLQDRLLAVYGGDLLVDAGDALWIRSARRKTRETFIRMLIQLQSFWERAGEAERADLCRRRARAAESADD